MNRKLPRDAFDFYFALGDTRTHDLVAEHYGVSRRGVAKLATKERWKERVEQLDAQARQRSNERLVETAAAMNERHLKVLKYIQGKAIETLKSQSINSGMDAVRAYLLTLSSERLIRGEPTERTETSVEQILKSQFARWMVPVGNGLEGDPQATPPANTPESGEAHADAA